MRRIERTRQFRRDYRRIKATPRYSGMDTPLNEIIERLANDQPLAASKRDHALKGRWMGVRDCHVLPDLLLLYEKSDPDVLRLVRLGSHSELFG